MDERPKFDQAPGIRVRKRNSGWEAFWRPRTDLVARGYSKQSWRLWAGKEPTELERDWVTDRCVKLQNEMLMWGRGGQSTGSVYDGTIASLIRCYETDPDSGYHKLRYGPRLMSSRLSRVIATDYGDVRIEDIRGRQVKRWHEGWSERGVAMSHGLVGKLRTMLTFGATLLDCQDCRAAKALLHDMRFPMAAPRTERMTAPQAIKIRVAAHMRTLHSIALAQAFQFELMLRQKDVIGEWIPQSEPGLSDVTRGQYKWLRGLRWSEIDSNLILRHVTSKKNKELVIDLKLAPMVMEELARLGERPTSGPVIISEHTGFPFEAAQYSTNWRKLANMAGVPKTIRNMDSRAGGISEATDAGAALEHVRHAATHSDIAMTQKYSRGSEEKIADVQRLRIEHRKNRKVT